MRKSLILFILSAFRPAPLSIPFPYTPLFRSLRREFVRYPLRLDVARTKTELSRLVAETFAHRSEEHTSELQSPCNHVHRHLLEKKKQSRQESQSVPIV